MKKLILASNSPRRKQIMDSMNLDFEVISSDYDENLRGKPFSYELIENVALKKAENVSRKILDNAVVIGADTVVVIGEKILLKPIDENEAIGMLHDLSGISHKVVTAVAAIDSEFNKKITTSTTSYITFNDLSDEQIKNYVAEKKPLDKAGAYGIQELDSSFIKSVNGSKNNIIGLSTTAVKKVLSALNYNVKKIVALFLLLTLSANMTFADTIWADDSIHDSIEQKYNIHAIDSDYNSEIPDLPNNLQNETSQSDKQTIFPEKQVKQTSKPVVTQKTTSNAYKSTYSNYSNKNSVNYYSKYKNSNTNRVTQQIKLKKGTKFLLRTNEYISDKSYSGTQIIFTSIYPETTRYITIPAGSKFTAILSDVHEPQLTGNGGLVKIDFHALKYKGKTYQIAGKITKVGNRKIFFNNIKGKRMYVQKTLKSTQPGRRFYSRCWSYTKDWFDDGLEIILTPFSFLAGVFVYGGNILISPVIGFFSKGGKLYIPKNVLFEMKLTEDAYINL